MPDDLLNRIRAELEQRLEATRAAREEYGRLERALAALEGADASAAEPARPRSARPPDRSNGAPPRRRAPRGQNRERVLVAVRQRPGVSAGEIAEAAGLGRGVLYALLPRLLAAGELEKEDLPGGRTGYVAVSSDAVSARERTGSEQQQQEEWLG